MTALAYTVRCTFPTAEVAEEWVAWMVQEHLADVRAAGATDALLVHLDVDAPDDARVVIEARYTFDSRAAFDRYLVEEAPRLRAAGSALFPPERGVVYERSTGDIIR